METAAQLKKAITQTKKKLKEFAKITGEYITTANVDRKKLRRAAQIRLQMDSHFDRAKELEVEFKKLQAELGASLPGKDVDTVEIIVDGIRLKKHPRNKLSGKLDEDKVFALAHEKGIFSEVTKPKVEINDDGLLKALTTGKITFEEYQECTLKEIIPVISLGYLPEDEDTE